MEYSALEMISAARHASCRVVAVLSGQSVRSKTNLIPQKRRQYNARQPPLPIPVILVTHVLPTRAGECSALRLSHVKQITGRLMQTEQNGLSPSINLRIEGPAASGQFSVVFGACPGFGLRLSEFFVPAAQELSPSTYDAAFKSLLTSATSTSTDLASVPTFRTVPGTPDLIHSLPPRDGRLWRYHECLGRPLRKRQVCSTIIGVRPDTTGRKPRPRPQIKRN
jgi:hypothetical protein